MQKRLKRKLTPKELVEARLMLLSKIPVRRVAKTLGVNRHGILKAVNQW